MPDVHMIPKEGVLERLENDRPFRLVEVLAPEQYREKHLPGAVNIPLDRLEEDAPEKLDKNEEIVVYCASYACQASTKAARRLGEIGFRRVLDYKGGKADWQKSGLPFEEGASG